MNIPIENLIQGGAIGIAFLLIGIIYVMIKKDTSERRDLITLFENHLKHNTKIQQKLVDKVSELITVVKKNGNVTSHNS